ncbi:MAG: hypothetical protein CL676_08940, partial [Bdellovibrionaceae bacterium]|nr:hypothetical protein [Pseudobdellovibrionaceae bacterium]
MSAAKKLDPFESQIMAALNELLSGKDHYCDPLNPFYDLDLEFLVRANSLPIFSKATIEDLFGPREEVKSFEIWKLSDKQNLLDQVQVAATNFGMNNTLIEDLLACADELITNSLFNAPFAQKVDRGIKELQIPGSEPIRMEISRG